MIIIKNGILLSLEFMKKIILALVMLLSGFSLTTFAGPAESDRWWNNYPMEAGRFNRSWESLNQWECPDWFRDAKLGIWVMTGPQSVPMAGDWYARGMYMEGHYQYNHHLKNYGHPSKHGYKDLINIYNPEKLNFDKVVKLYKDAGAKYVVMLAVHHDNFDMWDSKYHDWDVVDRMPHRDLVGEFTEAAKEQGLKCGLSTHVGKALAWMQVSHGSDKKGAMKGVPYDGADPKYKGLYCPPYKHKDDQLDSRIPNDPPEWWELNWYHRLKDLVESYQPDLLYFDGTLPFRHDDQAVGRQLLANFYNSNMKRNGGKLEAVMNLKDGRLTGLCVPDYERRGRTHIDQIPWQTDTCIGNWYYNLDAVRKYKTVPEVVFMLVDIVSKNGNLLLNIPIHPDGQFRKPEIDFLKGFGEWMKVNGEGIYETRPWLVYGEGDLDQTNYGTGGMHEAKVKLSEGDYRFTCKGNTDIFAFFMVWPERNVAIIKSLANHSTDKAKIKSIKMVGLEKELEFQWERDGLKVHLPNNKPCKYTWALHIKGENLRDFKLPLPKQLPYAEKVSPIPGRIEAENYDKGGQLVAYHDSDAGNSGGKYRKDDVDIRLKKDAAYVSNIEDGEWLEYTAGIELGVYEITASVTSLKSGNKIELYLDGKLLGSADIQKTKNAAEFQAVKIAKETLQESNESVFRVKFIGDGTSLDSLNFVKAGMPTVITEYLSDLEWVKHKSPTAREPYKDRDRDGGFLVINGTTYDKGIGCDSQVSITYDLNRQYLRFLSDAGVDDDVDADDSPASLEFQVYLDGKCVYKSGAMRWKTPVKKIDLDLTGVKTMELVVDDVDGSRNSDHANWANARLVKKIDNQ